MSQVVLSRKSFPKVWGRLRALAIIGPKRVSALPDVPTLTEAGLPDQETETILPPFWLRPARPKEIVDLLYREIAKIVAMPDVVQKLDGVGMFPVATTPEETSARIKSEIDMELLDGRYPDAWNGLRKMF